MLARELPASRHTLGTERVEIERVEIESPRARARPAAAALAGALPVRQLAGDARGHLRQASIGRAVPFAQAAFRQAFAGGHSLEDSDFVLIAAAACEMHPAAVLRGAELRSAPSGSSQPRRPQPGGRHRRARDRRRRARVLGRATRSSARRSRCAPSGQPAGGSRRRAADAAYELNVQRSGALEMKAAHAYRLIVTRGGRAPALLADPDARRPHRGGRDRQRRSGAVLGPRAAAPRPSSRARCAPTSRSWRRRSSSRAGVPWSTDARCARAQLARPAPAGAGRRARVARAR